MLKMIVLLVREPLSILSSSLVSESHGPLIVSAHLNLFHLLRAFKGEL